MGEIQAKIKSTLESTGIPYKRIEVYGRQIVVTSWSRSAAEKWGTLLATFARVRRVALKSTERAKVNKKTNLNPSVVVVWNTYAAID